MFWVALILPPFAGVVLALLVYRDSPVGGFCFTSKCVSYFLALYKLPIAISGLALPFVAMIASLHRSKEAHLQILVGQAQYSEAIKNNIFGNYLKHRDGFYDVIDRFISEESNDLVLLRVDQAALYSAIFPRNGFSTLDFMAVDEHWVKLSEAVARFQDGLNVYASSNQGDFEGLLSSYSRCVIGFHLSLERSAWFRAAENYDAIQLPKNCSRAAVLFSLFRIILALNDRINNYMGLEVRNYSHIFVGDQLLPSLQRDTFSLNSI